MLTPTLHCIDFNFPSAV